MSLDNHSAAWPVAREPVRWRATHGLWIFTWVLLLGLMVPQAGAQAMATGKRVALVIGNAAYREGRLANPVNDARLMEATLKTLGFDVERVENADFRRLHRAVREFGDRAQGADVALVYYAGHGMQLGNENWLVPVDADIGKQADVAGEAIAASTLLQQIEAASPRIALVVLDACRNNPFFSRLRSLSRGLARMDVPTGSIVAYSAQPGAVADDGEGNNGLYTKHLARFLVQRRLDIRQVFEETALAVEKESGGKQRPREDIGLRGAHYLAGPPSQVAVQTSAPSVATAVPTANLNLAPDVALRVGVSFEDRIGGHALRLAQVVLQTLEQRGRLDVTRVDDQPGGSAARPDWIRARAQGYSHLVLGDVAVLDDGRLEVRMRVWQVASAREVLAKASSAAVVDLRRVAFQVSDLVFEAVTQRRSDFQRRVARVSVFDMRHALSVSDIDGGGSRLAVVSAKPLMLPTWSRPDATDERNAMLAYVSFETGSPLVYVQSLSTGQRRISSRSAPVTSACASEIERGQLGEDEMLNDQWSRMSSTACRHAIQSVFDGDSMNMPVNGAGR
ncbi:caspase family protein [Sphaerotilus mobilis]|uniref:TolB-like protein n=1 Tax=Sphaerotilus mobilis TaxID=47994 RepID=A0A4Q7LRL2_9BURK|nr:caspase family protein [Sphaerotilus mobilis]RZS57121.1 TolB-like protein [Sphaerotilus mobilis]